MPKGFAVYAMVFAALQLLLLIFSTASAATNLHTATEVSRWPTTTGTVVHTWSAGETDAVGSSPALISHMVYQYTVYGRVYHGNRIRTTDEEWNSHAYIQEHPADSQVTVYYDPLWPELAVLDPGEGETTSTLAFTGIWGVATAVLFGLAVWANSAQPKLLGSTLAPQVRIREDQAPSAPESRESIWSGRP